ncbi:MAG: relaxase/mobilization nuclease domain-containing protein, partial [Bacteroidota bacterium]|nr:relaxase/mobilization nuclease domain-containing protein [Bacteroidota bacterium]
MISKIMAGKSTFGGACRYVCEDKKRSLILECQGVRGHDLALMEKDFTLQSQLRPEKKMPVFHAVLSFPPGEDPGNSKMVEIGRKYLKELGMSETQYAIVKHTDKAHMHLHVLANWVDNQGAIIRNSFIINRSNIAAQKLTAEYGLSPETGKHLEKTDLANLPDVDSKKYRLYGAIQEVLPHCRQVEDLAVQLLRKGISTRLRYDKETGERIGISFRIEGHAFKGSAIDPEYSIQEIQRTLTLQAE